VIENPDLMGTEGEQNWSREDQQRLNQLNSKSTQLQKRLNWYWDPRENYPQALYNELRLQYCMDKELVYKLVKCKHCLTTSRMVGPEQCNSEDLCYHCLQLKDRQRKNVQEKMAAWQQVRPVSENYPKRTEPGFEDGDLSSLTPGEKSVICLVNPAVTVIKSYFRCKKMRQESISILCEPDKTWVEVVPRDDLKDRFFVLERKNNKGQTKHVIANRN